MRVVLLAYCVALSVGTHWPRLQLVKVSGWSIDKFLHFGAFGVLAFLLLNAWPHSQRTVQRFGWFGFGMTGIAVMCALAYSLVDELTQGFVPGRTVTGKDMLANATGVFLGTVIWRYMPISRGRSE